MSIPWAQLFARNQQLLCCLDWSTGGREKKRNSTTWAAEIFMELQREKRSGGGGGRRNWKKMLRREFPSDLTFILETQCWLIRLRGRAAEGKYRGSLCSSQLCKGESHTGCTHAAQPFSLLTSDALSWLHICVPTNKKSWLDITVSRLGPNNLNIFQNYLFSFLIVLVMIMYIKKCTYFQHTILPTKNKTNWRLQFHWINRRNNKWVLCANAVLTIEWNGNMKGIIFSLMRLNAMCELCSGRRVTSLEQEFNTKTIPTQCHARTHKKRSPLHSASCPFILDTNFLLWLLLLPSLLSLNQLSYFTSQITFYSFFGQCQ